MKVLVWLRVPLALDISFFGYFVASSEPTRMVKGLFTLELRRFRRHLSQYAVKQRIAFGVNKLKLACLSQVSAPTTCSSIFVDACASA